MISLEVYLKRNYQTADQLAAVCSISADELATLVREQLVPAASYTVVDCDRFISQAFGELDAQGAVSGQYFHPGNACGVRIPAHRINPRDFQDLSRAIFWIR